MKLNKIGQKFSLTVVYYYGILLITVRYCTRLYTLATFLKILSNTAKVSIFSFKIYSKQVARGIYTENRTFLSTKCPHGFISFTTVHAKSLKFVPDFIKTLKILFDQKQLSLRLRILNLF